LLGFRYAEVFRSYASTHESLLVPPCCYSQAHACVNEVPADHMQATPILPQWFDRNRSLAQGIAAGGSGIGGIIFSSATSPMINNISLAWALRITGILSFVVLTVATTLMRDRHSTVRPSFKPVDVQLLKRYRVWLLIGYTFFAILGYIVTIYSLGENESCSSWPS
jgi:nitrate/nitrite transporter NarK